MLFDIKDSDTDYPIAAPLPLAPWPAQGEATIELCNVVPSFFSPSSSLSHRQVYIDSDQWRFYQPDYVLDISSGYLWTVCLDLPKISLSFASKVRLVAFLVRRQGSYRTLLTLLRTCILEGGPLSLLSKIFDVINQHHHHAIKSRYH
jgi:hypothetical protein